MAILRLCSVTHEMSLEEGRKMTKNINEMTQAKFDKQMAEIKAKNPNLFQFIADFVDRKVNIEEAESFLSMNNEDQLHFINGYQARA